MIKREDLLALSDEELIEHMKNACKRVLLSAHIRFSGCIPPSIDEKAEIIVREMFTQDKIRKLREELKKGIV